ncbi:hypothetical protein QUF80_04790 [Desulfococcaceae bacterium HSG8]|nr:hypothetical protein [Desulfococcaceae bacterium HSG8]
MMNRDEMLNALWNKNPFTSSSAGDPWERKYPDVEDVNKTAFEGLRQLIQQKAADPSENLAGIVLGDAGEGKTHLIGRILEYGRRTGTPFSFAYIQPIEDPEQTYRYLLREVIVNLCYPVNPSLNTTYLDRILANIFKDGLEKKFRSSKTEKHIRLLDKLREDPISVFREDIITSAALEYIEKESLNFMMGEHPKFPDNFLKILFQYRIPGKKAASVKWLKGSIIDDEDALLLGVRGRQDRTDASLEQEARDILDALGVLMARYGQPMVICFDRLENLETDEQIRAFGKMVESLVDTAKAMLPIAFVRWGLWEEKFRIKLNQHVIDRLESNELKLKRGCTVEQALDIIRNRLAFACENKEDDLFPFDRDQLIHMFEGEVESPREVIKQANKLLREIVGKKQSEPSIVKQLQEEFESQYQTILADFDRYAPDRGRLRRALKLYLNNTPPETGFEIVDLLKPHRNKYIDFECRIKFSESSVPAIFIIDMELHHRSVGASLKRGSDFLGKNNEGKAIYIRDQRCVIPSLPKWEGTNDKLRNFENLGGSAVLLDNKQAARCYALALLSYAVKEGDITVTDANNQMRPVSAEEFSCFIQEKIHGDTYRTFQNFDKIIAESSSDGTIPPSPDPPPPPVADDELVAEKAVEILRSTPGMMMMASQNLADSLNQSGITIDLEEMLMIISKFKDRFEVIPSKDGVLIMLKKEWLYAQS